MRSHRGWKGARASGASRAVVMIIAMAPCWGMGAPAAGSAVTPAVASAAGPAPGAAASIADSAGALSPALPADSLTVTAYYFHRTFRCETCIHVEQVIHGLLSTEFSKEVESGRIRWLPLDYESDSNAPLYAAYGLTGGPALILSRRDGRREIDWRVLSEIWDWIAFPEELHQRLAAGIRESLRPIDPTEDGAAEGRREQSP